MSWIDIIAAVTMILVYEFIPNAHRGIWFLMGGLYVIAKERNNQ